MNLFRKKEEKVSNILEKFQGFFEGLNWDEKRHMVVLMGAWRGPDLHDSSKADIFKTRYTAKIRAKLLGLEETSKEVSPSDERGRRFCPRYGEVAFGDFDKKDLEDILLYDECVGEHCCYHTKDAIRLLRRLVPKDTGGLRY